MAEADAPMKLVLYVNGRKPSNRAVVEALRELLDRNMAGQFELNVVDILDDPDALEEDDILATPTLLRRKPKPPRKLVGDFSDETAVLEEVRPELATA